MQRYDRYQTPAWYIINADWIRQWREYAADGSRAEPPGPINNEALLTASGTPRDGLRPVHDYRGISPGSWGVFVQSYGGGPAICRPALRETTSDGSAHTPPDIYLTPLSEEEAKNLEGPPGSTGLDECSRRGLAALGARRERAVCDDASRASAGDRRRARAPPAARGRCAAARRALRHVRRW